MKQNIFKIVLLVAMAIWIVCPDIVPGPIDDLILALIGVVQARGLIVAKN